MLMATRRARLRTIAALCAALIFPLAACGDNGNDVSSSGDPIKIGLLTDLTGILSISGIPHTRAARLAVEYMTDGTMEIAGRPVEFIERDDASDPEQGVAAARELIESEGVDFITATVNSGVVHAVMEIVEDGDVIYFPVAAAAEVTKDWFNDRTFRIGRDAYVDAQVMVRFVEEHDPEAVWALLAQNYAFGLSMVDGAHLAMENQSTMSFAEPANFLTPIDETDYSPYLQEIARTDATHLADFHGAGRAALYQQIDDLNLSDRLTMIGLAPIDAEWPDVYASAGDGTFATTPYTWNVIDTPVNQWFVERYIEEYGEPPNQLAGPAFSAVQAWVTAVEEADGSTLAADLIPILEGMTFDSVWGEIEIRGSDHAGLNPYYVLKPGDLTDAEGKWAEVVQVIPPEEAHLPCDIPHMPERCDD